MTNLEWLRTLPAEKLVNFLRESCRTCIHYCNCSTKDEYDCRESKVAWLIQEHKEELKPCPFCGSENVYILSKDGHSNKTAIIFCSECKSVVFIEDNEGEGYNDMTVARAIEAWNRRADDGKTSNRPK